MESGLITLEPSANTRTTVNPGAKLGFLNNCEMKFKQNESTIYFHVGADITLTKGIYYIDWAITETSTENYYTKAKKTKVEVVG